MTNPLWMKARLSFVISRMSTPQTTPYLLYSDGNGNIFED